MIVRYDLEAHLRLGSPLGSIPQQPDVDRETQRPAEDPHDRPRPVRAVGAGGAGSITVGPRCSSPGTSTVNFPDRSAVANGSQTPLSASGQICLYVSNTVHIVVDINGWWS